MKYTSLKSDIINILHSSDYNLNLKIYDKDGKTTLNPDDSQWAYINNYNMMIEFMTEDNHTIYIWKDTKNLDKNMKNIIQRMRELAILNGVSVQIRVYDNLNQRKIYNLVKSAMLANKENQKMNESKIKYKQLVESFQSIISIANNTKKTSDFYMSESILSQNTEKLLSAMFQEIKSLKTLKNINLSESFNNMMSAKSYSMIEKILSQNNTKVLSKLYECTNDIKNIASFVRNQYLNNIPFSNNDNTLFVLENVKVYPTIIKSDKDNLINAYNKLIESSDNVNDKIGLLKVIKEHNICESYNVDKNDLLNFWLEQNGKKISLNKGFIIEHWNGNKWLINNEYQSGIKAFAHYFNNGGISNSISYKNIVNECIKYNDIADFIINYKNDFNVRKFIPKFKSIFNECLVKLSPNFNQALFENNEPEIDYHNELNDLTKKIGVNHNALKYLAIEEARNNIYKTMLLNEKKNADLLNLVGELKNYTSFPSVVACKIVEEGINVNIPLNECQNDLLNTAKKLYSSISNNTDKVSTSIASTLFGIIHSKGKLNESKQSFIKTLLKYC